MIRAVSFCEFNKRTIRFDPSLWYFWTHVLLQEIMRAYIYMLAKQPYKMHVSFVFPWHGELFVVIMWTFWIMTEIFVQIIITYFCDLLYRENYHPMAGMMQKLNFCCRSYQSWTVTTSQVRILTLNLLPFYIIFIFRVWFIFSCL